MKEKKYKIEEKLHNYVGRKNVATIGSYVATLIEEKSLEENCRMS